ncbi:hypothetical protein [uncultured Clostridium sp.]|uniref:hypothetical protein n=2 Tax=uncultured Clostridium sp. TaxID=59620 RepID=UPI0026149D48|nr:hypothetical protein [uncultured Clostridium sp.]
MKKVLKIYGILSILSIFVFLSLGCSKKVEMIRGNTAEEAINLFNTYNLENNVENMVKLYSDEYVKYVGYDLNQIIKVMKKNRKNLNITSSNIKSIEEINENLKKVVITISAVVNNENTTGDYVYAIIKEDGGWSVSPDSIIECIGFNVPMDKKKELNLSLVKEAVQFDGALIRVNLYNDTNDAYVFGTQDEKTSIVVETTEGTFTSRVEQPQKIDKKVRNYFIAKIENLKGDIKKVTVTSVFNLDKDGNAILDTKRDIVVYNK